VDSKTVQSCADYVSLAIASSENERKKERKRENIGAPDNLAADCRLWILFSFL